MGLHLCLHIDLGIASGLSPQDALFLPTRDSPEFLRIGGVGTLAPGAPANLVIFRRDPTEDLRNLSTLIGVVAEGRLYLRSDLDTRLARYAKLYAGPGYSVAVMPALRTGMRILTSRMRG